MRLLRKEQNDARLLPETLDRQTHGMEVWSVAAEASRVPGAGLLQLPNRSLTKGQS